MNAADDLSNSAGGDKHAAGNGNGNGNGNGELTAQQLLLQQQQQLQLLQLAQLQTMSPGELASMAAVAQQVLGLVMMPMVPFMLPMNPALLAAAAMTTTASSPSPSPTVLELQQDESPSPAESPADSLSDVLATSAPPLALLGAPFVLPPAIGADETPKRKRGRPPKKDAAARAKADAERTLKQLPIWGYGLPLPLFPGFPGALSGGVAPSALTGLSSDLPSSGAQMIREDALVPKEEDSDSGFDQTGGRGARSGKAPAKKKARGTGKPRGRPRTRPRPGEIIRRVKPPTIAPATGFPVLYNYQLSGLAKGAELSAADAAVSHDDVRLAGIGASLLSGEHE